MANHSKKSHSLLSALALIAAAASVTSANAHVGFSRDNVYTLGDEPRQYKEGSTVFFDLTLPHACRDENNNDFATRGVRILFPNAQAIPHTYTSSKTGETYGANALMSVRARASAIWQSVPVDKGDVSPFFSHGLKSNDVRAIQWSDGLVDNDHYDRLEFRAKLPKIDPTSCVSSIKVVVPAVQWCQRGYSIAWIGTGSSVWGDGEGNARRRVETGYAPAFTIVRTSPLPTSCVEGGEAIEISPSVQEINKYLAPNSLRKVRRRPRSGYPFWRR